MEYLKLIIVFIAGGGITAIAKARYMSKTNKLDYADRAVKFMDKENEKLIERIDDLEKRIERLENLKCERSNCPKRINEGL